MYMNWEEEYLDRCREGREGDEVGGRIIETGVEGGKR